MPGTSSLDGYVRIINAAIIIIIIIMHMYINRAATLCRQKPYWCTVRNLFCRKNIFWYNHEEITHIKYAIPNLSTGISFIWKAYFLILDDEKRTTYNYGKDILVGISGKTIAVVETGISRQSSLTSDLINQRHLHLTCWRRFDFSITHISHRPHP